MSTIAVSAEDCNNLEGTREQEGVRKWEASPTPVRKDRQVGRQPGRQAYIQAFSQAGRQVDSLTKNKHFLFPCFIYTFYLDFEKFKSL